MLNVQGLKEGEMAKRQRVKGPTGRRGQKLKSYRVEEREHFPLIGGTREEIQRTLVETMRGILDGRITSKEAWRIGHACNAQLKLLGLMERLEQTIQREKRNRPGAGGRRPTNGGGKPWVN